MDGIKHRINIITSSPVHSFGPVAACWPHADYKIIRVVGFAEGRGSGGIDASGLEIYKDGAKSKAIIGVLIEEDAYALSLVIVFSYVFAVLVDVVLLGEGLEELSAYVVAALADLKVYDLAHDDIIDVQE